MNKINRYNYEAYFLDYIEGNLNNDLIDELEQFLSCNPDLKEELDQYTNSLKLENTSINFKKKNKLKIPDFNFTKPVNSDNINEYLIALHENDLSTKQINELKIFLDKNPHLQKINEIYKKTVLKADNNIQYKCKQKLYVNNNIKLITNRLIYVISSIAATIFLFILFFPFKNTLQTEKVVQTNIEKKIDLDQPVKMNKVNNNISLNTDIQDSRNVKTISVIRNIAEKPVIQYNKKIYLEELDKIQIEKIDMNIKNNALIANINQKLEISANNITVKQNKGTRKFAIQNPIDYNKDKKINYWELIKVTSNAINKITSDDLISFKFTEEGKFTEFAIKDDLIKITKN